ncbi:hypothetical protein N7G274_003767 [Stereocaulon virgatum]|uniref:Cell cycle control protein n=1 Tax=Stereocaulon virgatum TaxID=373712 RepID=A0ABR4ACH4_9LECA
MTLEDFEKSLVEDRLNEREVKLRHGHDRGRKHHRHHRHHEDGEDRHRHKRSRYSQDGHEGAHKSHRTKEHPPVEQSTNNLSRGKDAATFSPADGVVRSSDSKGQVHRDAWMEEPSGLEINFTQTTARKPAGSTSSRPSKADFQLKIYENEINKHHLQDLADAKGVPKEPPEESYQHEVNYQFGDSGAQWRMTKLKGVYRRAEETGRPIDDVAEEQFGDLQTFDDAREEQIELEKRDVYGKDYVGNQKPSGELFAERRLDMLLQKSSSPRTNGDRHEDFARAVETTKSAATTISMDQTALNRLKAQMLKAKTRGSSDAASLEVEYNNAMADLANRKQPEVVVLGAMDNRMLAGSRAGEVAAVDNKRGRERGIVEENEDMRIEDMVKQERRTRNQVGGDGQRFAERIAKDAKFDNNLEYMDENASKLAKRVQKSEIHLKNIAISDFQKMNRILDNCPLCHHEDTDTPPVAPVVSLATRVYLTLPTEPEISDGGACIIPVQHRGNLLECDDDEWEEIRNFMKSLIRMYHDQGRDVIFYENAAVPQRKKHAGMEVVPLPYSLGETAPAFFKEAILTSDEEWTQHKKLIDTLAKAKQGAGKQAFRRTLAKEMPYFHVWFEIDGGLGHIVEDANRWPKGDLFAREVVGGMLDVAPDVIKRQGRWNKGSDRRVDSFRERWKKFDWTRLLTDG